MNHHFFNKNPGSSFSNAITYFALNTVILVRGSGKQSNGSHNWFIFTLFHTHYTLIWLDFVWNEMHLLILNVCQYCSITDRHSTLNTTKLVFPASSDTPEEDVTFKCGLNSTVSVQKKKPEVILLFSTETSWLLLTALRLWLTPNPNPKTEKKKC